MYKDRVGHAPPDDPNAVIWRYLDFPKFMSLIHSSALFFAPLGAMNDPYEGALTEPQMARMVKSYNALRRENGIEPFDERFIDKLNRMMLRSYYESARARVFVNCWHLSQYESGAMWKVYGNNSLAIRSRYARLRESLQREDQYEVNIAVESVTTTWTSPQRITSGSPECFSSGRCTISSGS